MKLLTAEQLGEILGLSRRHVYRLEDTGQIPRSFMVGPGSRRWVESEIAAFIAKAPRRQVTQVKPAD